MKLFSTVVWTTIFLSASVVAAGDLLAGDTDRVWLVRPTPDGAACDVFVKSLGGSWQMCLRDQTGVPSAAVTDGKGLRLFFADRQHVAVFPDGEVRVAANLPGDFLAACAGTRFGGAEGDSPTAFVLVLRNDPPAVPVSDTQPAAAGDVKTPAVPLWYECLYRAAGNEWTPVAWRLLSKAPETETPQFLAVIKGRMYRWTRREGTDPKRPFVLRRFVPAPDSQADWVDVRLWPAEQVPLAMTAAGDRILLVHRDGAPTADGRMAPVLTRFVPDTPSPFSTVPLTRDQAVVFWRADAPPIFSRLGEQLALFWREGETDFFAVSGPAGAMDSVENVTEAILALPDLDWASDLYNYFLLAVVIVIGAGIFFRRRKMPPIPFVMPPGFSPGNLLKRFLAAVLDFLPFYLFAASVFLPRDLRLESLSRFLENPQSISPSLLAAAMYTMMLSQGLYVAYGTIMELRFGATLGKRILRLQAIREDGRRPGLNEAVLRNVTKVIELSMLYAPMAWLTMLFVLLPLLTRNRQRLGDMIARSAVVEASCPADAAEENASADS